MLKMRAMITLNTAPQANAFNTKCQGSLPYRAVFRMRTMKMRGIVNAETSSTIRKYGEIEPAMTHRCQRSPEWRTSARSFAWAAARRATGTRNGEQDT